MAGLITRCHLKQFFLTKGISVRDVGCVISLQYKYYRQGSILRTGLKNKVVINFPFLPQLKLPKIIKSVAPKMPSVPSETLRKFYCHGLIDKG